MQSTTLLLCRQSVCVREQERDNLNFIGLVSFVLFTSFLLCELGNHIMQCSLLRAAVHASHARHAIYNSTTLQRVCVCVCVRGERERTSTSLVSQSRPHQAMTCNADMQSRPSQARHHKQAIRSQAITSQAMKSLIVQRTRLGILSGQPQLITSRERVCVWSV